MKTFEDLEFKDRSIGSNIFGLGDIKRARMDFENGYGISVIYEEGTYCDNDGSNYGVAVMKDGTVTFNTPITDSILSYLTPEQITAIMREIQTYEKDAY